MRSLTRIFLSAAPAIAVSLAGCGPASSSTNPREAADTGASASATDAAPALASTRPDSSIPELEAGDRDESGVDGGSADPSFAADVAVPPDARPQQVLFALPACAATPPPTPPPGAPVCGDGWRDPKTEECDDGLGTSASARACNAACQVVDQLVATPVPTDAGSGRGARTLGSGRHPVAVSDTTAGVAYVELDAQPPTVSLATFTRQGAATGLVDTISPPGVVTEAANPVVAALSCDAYAIAWTDDGGDGDELGVAVRAIVPSTGQVTDLGFANTTTLGSQHDPDVVWTGSQIVVAWVDDSNPATAPDVRFRTYDVAGNVVSPEQTLSDTTDAEADVALTVFGSSWAAAWREDAGGVETVRVHTDAGDWNIGPAFLPAPTAAKPAIAALDATHLAVAYAVGVDLDGSGVASGSKVQIAVVAVGGPPEVSGADMPAAATTSAPVSQGAPNLVTIGGAPYAAFWTDAVPGDPKGEETWLKRLAWNGSTLDTSAPEIPLPRQTDHRAGAQRAPALAESTLPPGGAIFAAWDDVGSSYGTTEDQGDVAVQLEPVPEAVLACVASPTADAGSPSTLCAGGVMYVSARAGNDANDGCSPCTAKASIAGAVASLKSAGLGTDAGASAQEIHVCAGTYAEAALNVSVPVSLLGGYDCQTWTRGATYGWPTFDQENETIVTNGQYATQTSTLIVTAPAVIDGLTVEGTASAPGTSAALEVQAKLGVSLSNDHIVGGSNASTTQATFGSIGLYLNGDVGPAVFDDWIEGGSGYAPVRFAFGSIALYVSGAGGADVNFPSIHDNRILGGTGTGNTATFPTRSSNGIIFSKAGDFRSDPTKWITHNVIDGGTSNVYTTGVATGVVQAYTMAAEFFENDIRGGTLTGIGGTQAIAWPFGSLTIVGNRIYGGTANPNTNDGSVGIQLYGSGSTSTIVNNLIHGGVGPFPAGINLYGKNDVVAYNTIFSGYSATPGGGQSAGIIIGAQQGGRIFNNIVMGASTGREVLINAMPCMATTPAPIAAFQNNVFLGTNSLFLYNGGSSTCAGAPTAPYTIATMEQEIGRSGTASGDVWLSAASCPGPTCATACSMATGSEGTCLQSLFPAWSTADHGFTTLVTTGWPLQSGDPCAVTRGALLDTSLGALELVDFFGNARSSTGPGSVGAAEFDGTCN